MKPNVIQDLLSPGMKAIAAKLAAMDAISIARHNELLARIETVESEIETSVQSTRPQYEAIMRALVERRERKSPQNRIND